MIKRLLLAFLFSATAAAQQTIGPADTIKLLPVSLPFFCANGDLSLNTLTNNLSVCNNGTWLPFLSGLVSLPSGITGTLGVANGGTGLISGTNGGIPAFTGSTTVTSSGVLSANQLIVGGGANATPATLNAGSQYNVLTMNSTMPVYGQVQLNSAAAVTGTLAVGNGGSGAVTFTDHGVLLGNSTSPFNVTAVGSSNTVLHGNTGADPTYSAVSLSADTTGSLVLNTQVTGTLGVGNGGTGQVSNWNADGVLYASGTLATASTTVGSATQVLTSNGAGSAPTFQAPVTNNYFNGVLTSGSTWSGTSSSFTAATTTGTAALTTRKANGLTVTATSTTSDGITWTPSSSSAVYLIYVSFVDNDGTVGDNIAFRLYDGTNVIGVAQLTDHIANDQSQIVISGVYVPGTSSAVSVTIQVASSGNHQIQIFGGPSSGVSFWTGIEWQVVQIQ